MDARQTGKFISELRKQKGYTQKELAEKLAVTDKAVSRWETGKGFPDTALLKPLSELLGVSVGELLAGEHIQEEQMKDQTDRVILDSLNYSKKRLSDMVNLVLIILGACPIALFIFGDRLGYVILGAALIVVAILRIILKRKYVSSGRANRTVYLFAVIYQALALFLEFLPFSAISHYFAGPNDTFVQYHSYFSMTAFGGGHLILLPTGLMTITVFILTLISLVRYKKAVKIKNAAFICSIITLALSLIPLVFMGSRWMTSFGYAISGLMILSICLQAVANRNI